MIGTIPTPYHLLPLSATFTPATITISSAGVPSETFSSGSVTVACNLQPASNAETLEYQRATGQSVYDLFFAPVDTSGTAFGLTAAQVKTARVTIGGTTYRCAGTHADLVTNGCLYRVTLEVDA